MASDALAYLAVQASLLDGWRTILRHVEENKQHQDGTPMLANNIGRENVTRLLGR